jgi:carboxymethylenebutenolidase
VDLSRDWVSVDTPAGPTAAFLAVPAPGPGPRPGVLVLQEVWGVDDHIRDVTERLADAGYVALAPDLNSAGGGRPVPLTTVRVEAARAFLDANAGGDYPTFMGLLVDHDLRVKAGVGAEEDETLAALLTAARLPRHVDVVRAACSWLRAHPACAPLPVGVVGFCQGGALAGALACSEPGVAATVIYYGTPPPPEAVAGMAGPVRGFYGSEDHNIAAALPAFAAALAGAGVSHELRVYDGARHAFANDTRPWFHPAATRDAWARTLRFLAERLGPAPSTVVD